MADTDIEWASKVWNVTRGCRRVSAGCGGAAGEGGCYAERQAYRFSSPGMPYDGLVRMGKNGPQWTGKGRFVTEKLAEPLRWRAPKDGSRLRIFVNSMSDLFFEEFSDEDIAAAFGVMAACQHHDFLILTKRAKRMQDLFALVETDRTVKFGVHAGLRLPDHGWLQGRVWQHWSQGIPAQQGKPYRLSEPMPWPLPNVWLGVSAEDQETADERIPLLLETPAAVRWVSYEPALGPVDFAPFLSPLDCSSGGAEDESLDWVIVGGESGPGARPFDLAWARSVVEQCKAAGTACFVKQLGAKPSDSETGEPTGNFRTYEGRRQFEIKADIIRLNDRKGGDISEFPEALRVREFPR